MKHVPLMLCVIPLWLSVVDSLEVLVHNNSLRLFLPLVEVKSTLLQKEIHSWVFQYHLHFRETDLGM